MHGHKPSKEGKEGGREGGRGGGGERGRRGGGERGGEGGREGERGRRGEGEEGRGGGVGEGYLERVGEERQLLSLHHVLLLILQQHEGTELVLHYIDNGVARVDCSILYSCGCVRILYFSSSSTHSPSRLCRHSSCLSS